MSAAVPRRRAVRGEGKANGRKYPDDDAPTRPAAGRRRLASRRSTRHRGADDDSVAGSAFDSAAGSVAGSSVAGSLAGSVAGESFRGDLGRPPRAKDKFREMQRKRRQEEAERAHRRRGGALAEEGALADAAKRVLDEGDLRRQVEETHLLAKGEDPGDPEVHIVGEVMGGSGFEDGVSCKFVIQAGPSWKKLQGNPGGQTHVIYKSTVSTIDVWAHPIDIHFVAGSVEGWPRILLQVWKLDDFGRHQLQGYGFVHIPPGAGSFDLEVPTWRPVGDNTQEMKGFFLGSVPQLKDTDLLFSRATDRKYLVTQGSGTVRARTDGGTALVVFW